MSKEVQRLFSSIAPTYDFLNHFLSLSIDKKWRDRAVEGLNGRKPERVLDLCAGTLDLSQKISEKFPQAEVIAADFALAMLEEGKKKVEQNKRVFRVCADGHRLPFPDASFDALFCAFGIRNLEERETAAQEIFRVLKPGGTLVVLEFFRPDRAFSKIFHQTYGKHILPRLGGIISKNRGAYEYLQESINNFFTVKEYQNFLNKNNFEKINALALSGGIAHRVVANRKTVSLA